MEERGLGLAKAHVLMCASNTNTGPFRGINWQLVTDQFLESRADRRASTLGDLRYRVANVLMTLEVRRVACGLKRLVGVKAVESVGAGTETTSRASHDHNRRTRTGQPISHANGFQLFDLTPDNPDSDGVSFSMSGMFHNAPDIEKGGCDFLARVSGLSDAPSPPPGVKEIGEAVERQRPEGRWRNGWVVADVIRVSSGATRYRIESDGESSNLAAAQIRLCAEVA